MVRETPTSTNEVSIRDILALFRRRKGIILQTFAVILAVGIAITVLTKPVYRTSTEILVDGKQMALSQVNASDPMSSLFMPNTGYDVSTQIEVLQSDEVLERAHKAAGIPFDKFGKKENRLVDVKVKQVQDTNVIEITCDSRKPLYAEHIAQKLPEVYKSYITGNGSDEVNNALKFTMAHMDDEQKQLDKAQAALENYKKNANVTDFTTQRQDLINRSSQADSEERQAISAAAGAKAHLDAVVAARAAIPAFIEQPSVVSNTQRLDALRDDVAKLEADKARAGILFKPNSPQVEQIQAQLDAARARLTKTPEKITNYSKVINPAVQTYDDKVTEARATYNAAQAALVEVHAKAVAAREDVKGFNNNERKIDNLQQEIDRRKGIIDSLSKNLEALQLKQYATHDPVSVISPTQAAVQIAPRYFVNLVLSVLLGLVLGIAFAMLQEYLDDRVNAPDEARSIMGVPALGYVPLISGEGSRLIADLRGGSTLESYRVLRSNVQFATVDESVCSVMVTSTNPGEGKSTTAVNLAIAMALDGKRVILVDADLRLPTVHEKLGLSQQPGMTTVLLGRRSLEEALQSTSVEGLRVLTAGSLPPNPAEILNSLSMRQLHEELKEMADIVIFDAPPCLATADAQVISSFADGVLYVMQLGSTKKSPVRHATEMLRQAHANLLGVVFNKIDLSSSKDNYYYSYSTYYGNYQNGKNGYLHQNGASDKTAIAARNGSADKAVVAVPEGREEEKKA